MFNLNQYIKIVKDLADTKFIMCCTWSLLTFNTALQRDSSWKKWASSMRNSAEKSGTIADDNFKAIIFLDHVLCVFKGKKNN